MRRTLSRALALGLAGLGVFATVALIGTSNAYAEHESRALHITRVDGSPVGTLFTDWVMVPGDTVSATVLAHRTGHGASSLLITLGDLDDNVRAQPTSVEEDVIIHAAAKGRQIHSSAAALMKSEAVLDLGRSSDAVVPIEVTFELPFSSTNATQQQAFNLSLVVTAADIPTTTPGVPSPAVPAPAPAPEPTHGTPNPDPTAPTAPAAPPLVGNPHPAEAPVTATKPNALETVIPLLPGTGASVRELLIAAASLTTFGLLFLGGRRNERKASNHG